MATFVHLWSGEKDGQKFPAPWEPGKHPKVFYAITVSGDEELLAYGREIPPGLKEELAILAYTFEKESLRVDGLVSKTELRYIRTPELDRTPAPPKPRPRSRSKKQGPQ